MRSKPTKSSRHKNNYIIPFSPRIRSIFFILFLAFVSSVCIVRSMRPLFEGKSIKYDITDAYQLKPGEAVIQKLHIGGSGGIDDISIRIGTNARVNTGKLRIRFLENTKTVNQWEKDTAELADNVYQKFKFASSYKLDPNAEYAIEIMDLYEGENGIALWASSGGDGFSSDDESSVTDDRTVCYQLTILDVSMYRKIAAIVIVLIVLAAILAAIMIDFDKNSKLRIVLAVFCLIILIFMLSIEVFERINKEAVVIGVQNNSGTETLTAGETREFLFTDDRCGFDALNFYVENSENGVLQARLSDDVTGEILYDAPVTCEEFLETDKARTAIVRLNTDHTIPEGQYRLSLINIGPDDLTIVTSDDEDKRLAFSLIKYTRLGVWIALVVTVLLILYMMTMLLVCHKESFGMPEFFLLTATVTGIIYFILMAPWNIPDSSAHFSATYRFSNILLGFPKEQQWSGRVEDGEFYSQLWGYSTNPSMQCYSDLTYNFKLHSEKNDIVDMPFRDERMEYYSIVNYWPQILGFTFGRYFNLSAIACVYLARFGILLFYILACWHAVRITPVGKSIFTLIPLMPMPMMMSSAISYDPMVIITSLNFVACILALCKKPGSKRYLLEAALWAFAIGGVKGGGYLLLLPLALIYYGRERDKKKDWIHIFIIIASGLFSVLLFDKILQIGKELFQFGTEGNGKMEAAFAIRYPFEYLRMTISTYVKYANTLIHGMMGTDLARLENTIPGIVVILPVAAMSLYALFEQDEIRLQIKDKAIMMCSVLLVILFTPMMLLSWTNVGSTVIEGLQGRYYLPVFAVVLLVITKFSFSEVKPITFGKALEEIKVRSMLTFAGFTCLAVFFMMRLYLVR